MAETSFNPRFSIAFEPNPNFTLYAQAAKGFRIGGPNIASVPGIPSTYGSDSLWNYEIGAKGAFLDGRGRFSGALFYINWSDLQVSLVEGGFSFLDNAGAAEIHGAEFETSVALTDQIDVGLSLAYSKARLTEDVPNLSRVTGIVGVQAGDRLPATPEFTTGAYVRAITNLLGTETILHADVYYMGKAYTDFAEQGAPFGDYASVNLRANVPLGPVTLGAFVENLFDSDGARSASGPFFSGPVQIQPALLYRIAPRTFGFNVSYRF